MEEIQLNISTDTLRIWLDQDERVFVLDVRPKDQREEWQIPGSFHLDAYQRLNAGDASVLDEINIPEKTKVVTVCAAGRTSEIAANELRKKGVEAYSLEGGMKDWSLSWNIAEHEDGQVKIIQVRRTGKGCLSYLIGSGNEAIVIDASLDPEIYLKLAEENGWKIKYVLDTHIHADHLSRSLALAEIANAHLYMPDNVKLKYHFLKMDNRNVLHFGPSSLKAIHTPGHTIDSTTYSLNDSYLFTGDTLFIEGVGRPDLKADEEEVKKRASMLFHSLQNLIRLDKDSLIFPGHTSKPVPFDHQILASTLKEIKTKVSSLNLTEQEFVTTILAKIPPTPPNYLKVVEMNINGDIKSLDPKEVEAGANRCSIS